MTSSGPTETGIPASCTPATVWLLRLLFAPGPTGRKAEGVTGKTRLIKELFLLRHQAKVKDSMYEFFAHRFGPDSREAHQDLEALQGAGLVRSVETKYGDNYLLTQTGQTIARKLWQDAGEGDRRKILGIKSRFNRMPINELLGYVYSRWPKFTDESEIKDQVLGNT